MSLPVASAAASLAGWVLKRKLLTKREVAKQQAAKPVRKSSSVVRFSEDFSLKGPCHFKHLTQAGQTCRKYLC